MVTSWGQFRLSEPTVVDQQQIRLLFLCAATDYLLCPAAYFLFFSAANCWLFPAADFWLYPVANSVKLALSCY
jgi:hypothetical protein